MGLISTLIAHGDRQQELELQRSKFAFDRNARILEAQRKLRGSIDEAYQRFTDPQTGQLSPEGKTTIGELFKGYSFETGGDEIDPDLVKAFQDPRYGSQILAHSNDQNMTMGQVLETHKNPFLRAQFRLAAAKGEDERAIADAVARGETSAPASATTPGPVPAAASIPQLGAGLQVPGVTNVAPMLPAPAASSQPTAAPAPAPVAPAAQPLPPNGPAPVPVTQTAPAATLPAANAPVAPPGGPTPAIQAAVDQMDKGITSLRANISVLQQKQANPRLIALMSDRLKQLLDQRYNLTTKFAADQAAAQAAADRQPLPSNELKESNLPIGTTYGDARRMMGDNAPRMLTPMQSAAVGATAQASGQELQDTFHQGSVARQTLPMLDIAAKAGQRIGPTGPLVTPIKDGLYAAANLFGIQPKGQSALQIIQAIEPRLAVQLTSQMKGQQSDREFLAGLMSAANSKQNNRAYAMVIMFTKELAEMAVQKEIQARAWVADPSHPGLNIPDRYGKTFQERYDQLLESRYNAYGTIGDRIAKSFGYDYKDILAGKLTPKSQQGR